MLSRRLLLVRRSWKRPVPAWRPALRRRNSPALIHPDNANRAPEREHHSFGWFALVCYVPDPQRSFLETLRHSIPGKALAPVHVTVLPPRPLRAPVNEACLHVQEVAREFSAFEAELSEVRHFAETDFLYLDIAEGNTTLCDVHRKLDAGKLQFPETYAFRPHLTLGGPVPVGSLASVQKRVSEQWKDSECPRRLPIEELVCLWLAPNTGGKHWEHYGSFYLKGANSRQAAAPAHLTNRI